jgi:hypothetical protein
MPDFLYKVEQPEEQIPGQICAEFHRDEYDEIAVWCDWLQHHGFPDCAQFTRWGNSMDTFVWCPSDNHMMMHRLRWGGVMASN